MESYIKENSEKIDGLIGVVFDITERKLLEDQVEEHSKSLEQKMLLFHRV